MILMIDNYPANNYWLTSLFVRDHFVNVKAMSNTEWDGFNSVGRSKDR